MIFCVLNPEKIWHQRLLHFLTPPVYCSHFTLGNQYTSDYLHYLRRKQTVTLLLATIKNVIALPCKIHKFCSFLFFTCIEYQSAIRTSYGSVFCDIGWNSAHRGGRCSWSVVKKTRSMYPCRRWSLWTFAVTLLAWHSICRKSQPVLFRATNANPQPAFVQSHQRLEERTYLQSDENVVHFNKGSGVTFFRCGG